MEILRKIPNFGYVTLSAIALGITGSYLFFDHGIGVNFPVFVVLTLAATGLLHALYGKELRRQDYILMALALFFATMVYFRASPLLTFFNVLGSILLLFLVAYAHGERNIREFTILHYARAVLLPFSFLKPFFSNFHRVFRWSSVGATSERDKQIVRGILVSAIVVTIFTIFLSSADPIFSSYVEKIFHFESEEWFARLIFGLIIAALFFGAFCYFYITEIKGSGPSLELKRNLGLIETSILLASVNVLFLLFMLVQVAYLFGGEAHLEAHGLTYADYARRGFFELNVVAIFSFLVLFTIEKLLTRQATHQFQFRWLGTLLVALVVFILLSAFQRLMLYEDAYGYTTIRLYSYAFMIWLAVVLVLLAYQIMRGEEEHTFMLRGFMAVLFFLFAMNVINPDAFIARKNIDRYHETGKIDTYYLSTLSDDAIPVTITLFEDNKEAGKTYASYISEKKRAIDQNWQSTRLSTKNADDILSGWSLYIEENKEAARIVVGVLEE